MRILPADDAAPTPLGQTGLYFEEQRRFARKSLTLAAAIVALAPLIIWKSVVGTTIYLAILVAIHVFALVVFVNRVPWRALFAHPLGLITRTAGLVIFGVLLGMIRLEPNSNWFWGALTLLWLFHVGALATLHVRHHREMAATSTGGCPVGPFSPPTPGDPADPRR